MMEKETQRKRVLITGANGLLGANAAICLYRNGFEVRAMVRKDADLKALEGLPCAYAFGDISNYADVEAAVAGCDMVVHAAAVTGQWNIGEDTYRKVNIEGTRHIIKACLRHHISRLVYISTANTLAPGSLQHPGNELGGFSLFCIGSDYINTKYIAQQLVLEAVAGSNLPAVIIHPTFMIGAYDSKPSSGQLLRYALSKKILCYPPGGKNFVHVADVCLCILGAIKGEHTGQCFLAAAENLSYRDFFRKVNTCSGQRPWMIRIPATFLLLAGLCGSLAGYLSGRKRKLNYSTARLLCLKNYYTGRKAADYFKFRYQSTDQAISDALNWFNTNKFS